MSGSRRTRLRAVLTVAALTLAPAVAAGAATTLPTWTQLPTANTVTAHITAAVTENTLPDALYNIYQRGAPMGLSAAEIGSQKFCTSKDNPMKNPPCVFGSKTSSRVVVVVGDSEGEMWLPALNLWGIQSNVKILRYVYFGCPPWHLPLPASSPSWTNCSVNWHNFIESKINSLKPYAVIAAGMTGVNQSTATVIPKATLTTGMKAFFTAIQSGTTRRIVLANPPWFVTTNQSPVACAMINHRQLTNCNGTVKNNIDATMTFALTQTANAKLATVIPVKQLFCTATTCPVVANGTFVYTDTHHISHDWSVSIARALATKLNPALGLPAAP